MYKRAQADTSCQFTAQKASPTFQHRLRCFPLLVHCTFTTGLGNLVAAIVIPVFWVVVAVVVIVVKMKQRNWCRGTSAPPPSRQPGPITPPSHPTPLYPPSQPPHLQQQQQQQHGFQDGAVDWTAQPWIPGDQAYLI